MNPRRLAAVASLGVMSAALTVLPAEGSPSETYVGPHVGDEEVPAECLLDTSPANPDNRCLHMKVGLNALDSPKVDVAVLAPVSPAVERDLRLMKQVVHMWEGGIDYLSDEMGLDWLGEGVDFRVTLEEVVVDDQGLPVDVVSLTDPEIVVIATNPVGGIGIGIDPSAFIAEIGITDGEGVPCTPGDLTVLEDEEHGEDTGIYVEDCGGSGGNVCFAFNGAIDPVPGTTDLFGIFDLVSHEFGHCLTLGHVGDGADGPWGPTPTNDIMAYSTDPPGITKCVSTLNVEGFALRMSRYLDRNGDGEVTEADRLEANDLHGDGRSSFHVQHPHDHSYASATGDARDCPQPDSELLPGVEPDWTPAPAATTRPSLGVKPLTVSDGRLSVTGGASWVPIAPPPTAMSGSTDDASGDSTTPVTDITGFEATVTDSHVNAVVRVADLAPADATGSAAAYSVVIDGRRFDSFVPTTDSAGGPVVIDNGAGVFMPDGTATWDDAANTVTFAIPRWYLKEQWITAPYDVNGQTGLHARTNDWLVTEDLAPDVDVIALAGPPAAPGPVLDKPKAGRVTTTTTTLQHEGGNSFLPTDSSFGLAGFVSAWDTRHFLDVPVAKQATVELTLTWEGDGFLDLQAVGGSGQETVRDGSSVTVTVPWARRDLVAIVDPQEIFGPVTYTLTATTTTVVADGDSDRVPNVADVCPTKAGPRTAAGCPDTDRDTIQDRFDDCPLRAGPVPSGCASAAGERVVVFVDGTRAAATSIMTKHGYYPFDLSAPVSAGPHSVRVVWYAGSRVVREVNRSVG